LSGNGKLCGARCEPDAILGVHPSIREVREAIERVAPTTQTVLLSGETGTGKKLVASAIHAASPRARGPFVELRCDGLGERVLASELFGQSPRDGDAAQREGRLREAHGGTLFLGDVAEIPPRIQGEILDFLERGAFEPAGGGEAIRADARLIAATQRDLRHEAAAGRFREDLFHRLDAVRIEIPALRERSSDVPLLAAAFLARSAERLGLLVEEFAPDALEMLLSHPWPGNVRELENAIERAALMVRERWIRPEHLQSSLHAKLPRELEIAIPGSTLAEIERVAILRTLEAVAGSTSRAASVLGISTRKIQYRVREYRESGRLGTGLDSSRRAD